MYRLMRCALIGSALLMSQACGHFGYSSRVLWRVGSPDATMTAVCQEVPMFDGPAYDVRIENADGRLLRELYRSYEADDCDEVVWAADGRTLAVVTRHVGRVRLVDVALALANRNVKTGFVRIVNYSSEGDLRQAWNVRFTAAAAVDVCPYLWEERRQTGAFRCTAAVTTERLALQQMSSHP